jgi:hypothetical protein
MTQLTNGRFDDILDGGFAITSTGAGGLIGVGILAPSTALPTLAGFVGGENNHVLFSCVIAELIFGMEDGSAYAGGWRWKIVFGTDSLKEVVGWLLRFGWDRWCCGFGCVDHSFFFVVVRMWMIRVINILSFHGL